MFEEQISGDNFESEEDFVIPKQRRRTVTLVGPERTPLLGRTKLWAYGYADLSHLFGVSVNTIRKHVERGKLNPASLEEIIDYFLKHRPVDLNSLKRKKISRRR